MDHERPQEVPVRDASTVAEMCVGLGDAEASRRLGTASGGLAFWVAAIRESFEEAGVLMARHADGSPLTLGDPRVADRFATHRTDVDGAERTIEEIAREEGIRFFVAAVPADQEVVHDDHELISTDWLTPDEALRRHDAGEIVMIFPTVRTLVALARFDRSVDVLAHARSLGVVQPVVPTVTESDHGVRILLPGDPEGTGGAYDPWTARPLSS